DHEVVDGPELVEVDVGHGVPPSISVSRGSGSRCRCGMTLHRRAFHVRADSPSPRWDSRPRGSTTASARVVRRTAHAEPLARREGDPRCGHGRGRGGDAHTFSRARRRLSRLISRAVRPPGGGLGRQLTPRSCARPTAYRVASLMAYTVPSGPTMVGV